MALAYRTISKNCYYINSISKLVQSSIGRYATVRILPSGICYQNNYFHKPLFQTKSINLVSKPLRLCSSNPTPNENVPKVENKGVIARFKQMYKDYWYVVLPVHFATSCVWFGSFYYTVRSGVDVISLLKTIGVSETILAKLGDSSAGYFALAFALYKLATPLRYAVTVGATTLAIKRLTRMGLIKPVPSRERLKEIYNEKKGTFQDRIKESRLQYSSLREKKTQVMEEMKQYKTNIRNMKDKVKKT